MSEEKEKSLRMLASALEMEEKGRAFYEKAALECYNELGKEIFTILKDYEIVHTDRIKKIYQSLEGGAAWLEEWVPVQPVDDLPLIFKQLAERHASHIKPASDLEALEIGLELEESSIRFYDKHMIEASDPLEKKFIEQMLMEEREHFRILADMKYYYSDPEGWLMEKEHLQLDGA